MIKFKYFLQVFPKYEDQAEGLWQEICSSLAPENLHEDGEIPSNWADRKFEDIHHDAKLLAKAWPCPKHIADRCDDDISMYAKENV